MSDALEGAHPGMVLKLEILEKLGMSQNYLAHMIHVPANRIHDIVRGRRSITADTDIRLCKFFSLPEGYWLRVQNSYDLAQTHVEKAAVFSRIEPYQKAGETMETASLGTVAFPKSTMGAETAEKSRDESRPEYDLDDVL